MSSPRYLFAIDMDGTLLRDDKTIADADVAAIRDAASQGIAITIATGRLKTGTLPTARELRLTTPVICADGGLLVDPETGESLDCHSISIADASAAVQALIAHGLAPFVFSADAIHCDQTGAEHRSFVETWSKELIVHESLATSDAWKHPEGVSVTVGIGSRAEVEEATAHLQRHQGDQLDTIHFGMASSGIWAARSLPRGCDKANMLQRLASRLQVPRARVVAVGDWLNDLGMFQYAARSFAMGQAPAVVKDAATDVLRATSERGGGIAEALTRLRRS
jgi:Cof subfamily protein (haloacid dehalogenase superfamily)